MRVLQFLTIAATAALAHIYPQMGRPRITMDVDPKNFPEDVEFPIVDYNDWIKNHFPSNDKDAVEQELEYPLDPYRAVINPECTQQPFKGTHTQQAIRHSNQQLSLLDSVLSNKCKDTTRPRFYYDVNEASCLPFEEHGCDEHEALLFSKQTQGSTKRFPNNPNSWETRDECRKECLGKETFTLYPRP